MIKGLVVSVDVLVQKFPSGCIVGLYLPFRSVLLFGIVRCVWICWIRRELFVRRLGIGVGSRLEQYVVIVVNNVKDWLRLGLMSCQIALQERCEGVLG